MSARSTDNKPSFIFCVHAHQPVGNFSHVFEEAYEKCYLPFIEALEDAPGLPAVLHFSGPLLDWLEENRPDAIGRILRLASGRDLEILGGAHYEPIYHLISAGDLKEQILMMRERIERLFGQTPEGVWLTERVWDPSLAGVLSACGVRYTVLDEASFAMAGLKSPSNGYCRLPGGEPGAAIDLFSSSKSLRYLIPFREPGEAFREASKIAGPAGVAVFADDCEKFGLWPGTQEWVVRRRYLQRFFSEADRSKMTWTTFRAFRRSNPPAVEANIPSSSYGEMMEWAGGSFERFFDKYSESRYMKDRMRYLSSVLSNGAAERLTEEELRESKKALFRAQCNCPYWHGVFGGLYLHHLRSAVYGNLIRAEESVQDPRPVRRLPLESGERVKLRSGDLAAFVHPGYGAALEELDHLPLKTNLLCTLKRRPEPYHRFVMPKWRPVKKDSVFAIHQILGVKEKGLDRKLVYDAYRRHSFMDHFFEKPVTWDAFHASDYREAGDLIDASFEVGRLGERSASFVREGVVRAGGAVFPVRLEKTYDLSRDGRIEMREILHNLSERPLSCTHGVEFNFSIGVPELTEGLSLDGVLGQSFRCAWTGIDLTLATDHPSGLLACPIETVSESESGMEGTFQQLSVLLQRPIELKPGRSLEQRFTLEVSKRS